MQITASNIVSAIDRLSKKEWYNYINSSTRTQIKILRIVKPEGPIFIERKTADGISKASISTEMIWRIANAIVENVPLNFDRILGASYNTRSAVETLLAHTPDFFWCKPGRIEIIRNSQAIKEGHKHLLWLPSSPHANGQLQESPLGNLRAISELPQQFVAYDALIGFEDGVPVPDPLPIDVKRRHLQIQIALLQIGNRLGFRTWIAQNDKGFKYGQTPIGEMEGVISRLSDERVLAAYEDAIHTASLIDCIWFKNGKLMPAVMEVEHTTGVTSGLTRMKKLQDFGPALAGIRWVIVAPDEDRNSVFEKANHEQFFSLNTQFFPYSAVEELHSLCHRRGLSGECVNEKLLDCFMEPCRPQ